MQISLEIHQLLASLQLLHDEIKGHGNKKWESRIWRDVYCRGTFGLTMKVLYVFRTRLQGAKRPVKEASPTPSY